MIRITDIEKIKSKGDFKLDGLHVKRYHFDFPTTRKSKIVVLSCMDECRKEANAITHEGGDAKTTEKMSPTVKQVDKNSNEVDNIKARQKSDDERMIRIEAKQDKTIELLMQLNK